MQMLAKSLSGEEIARELITVLSVTYHIHPDNLMGAMRDRASINNVAMHTLLIVCPKVVDSGCFLTRLIMFVVTSKLQHCLILLHHGFPFFLTAIRSGYCGKLEQGEAWSAIPVLGGGVSGRWTCGWWNKCSSILVIYRRSGNFRVKKLSYNILTCRKVFVGTTPYCVSVNSMY